MSPFDTLTMYPKALAQSSSWVPERGAGARFAAVLGWTAFRSYAAARSGEALAEVGTHAFGLLLAVVGAAVLLLKAADGGVATLASVGPYAVTLVLLYAASTLYHSAPAGTVRERWRRLDHCAIYGLIAGTYTPICVLGLERQAGVPLLAVLWLVVLVGAVLFSVAGDAMTRGACGRACQISYLVCGWSLLAVIGDAVASVPSEVLLLILVGGIAYTTGIAFFLWERRYCHAIWHLFVLAGSLVHYRAILLLLDPAGR